MLRGRALLLAAAVLIGGPIAVQAQDGAGATLVSSENEARGDFSAWLGELCADVAANPDDPAALACLSKIRNVMGSATDPTVVEKTLEPVLAAGVSDGETEEALRDALARRAEARGDFEAARAYGGNAGYLRRFGVIGPFEGTSSALVWKSMAPEAPGVDFQAALDGTSGKVRWLELPVIGDSPWISPSSQIKQGGRGVMYGVAHVRAGAARDVALKVWCSSSFRVMVNGEDAIVADRTRDRTPSVVWGSARLESGWNRVLVKVVGNDSFSIKLVDDTTGKPLTDLEEGAPFETDVFTGRPQAPAVRSYRTPWERAEQAAATGSPATTQLVAAAALADGNGLTWEALGLWERAAASLPTGPSILAANVRAAYGRQLASFGEYPQVHRKLLAREQFEAALVHDPLHNSATLRLAGYEDEDDRPDKAVDMLRKYVEKNPSETALMSLARITQGRGWEKEALDAAQAALDIAPNSTDALEFLIAQDRRFGNHESLVARTRQLLEIDGRDSGAANTLIKAMRARGDDAAALTELRTLAERWPSSFGWRSAIARVLRALGRHDESLAVWRELEKLVPDEETYPREIGELLEIAGDKQGAAEAYRRSLARRPFQAALWRNLARLEGAEFDFAAGWEPDVQELMGTLPSDEELKEKYPKAIALTVMDHAVVKAHDDGSSVSYVDMLYKLLDEKGVEKYSDMPKSGELIEIAAYLPDGTRMLPTGLSGRSYNMEGLVPGSFVHHRYISFAGPGKNGKFDPGGFYFQDHQLGRNPNPVLLSRWVILTPKDIKLTPDARGFPEGSSVEDFQGLTATVWEKRDMPRITRESNMPPVDQIVPFVNYTEPPTFEDANWGYLGGGGTWSTPVLEKALAEAVKDGMSDREKLEAIHRWVNDEITGNSGTSRSPTGTIMEKAGNRSQLFEALVRCAGIPFRHGRAMAWNGVGTPLDQATAAAFNQRFLWLEPRGSEPLPFVMGARLAPFGLLPEAYRGSAAFLADRKGGRIIQLGGGRVDVRDTNSFDIHLGADPSDVTVEGTLMRRSPGNYYGKKQINELSEDIRQKVGERQLSSYFAGPKLTEVTYPDLMTPGAPLVIGLKGTMSTYLSQQGDRFVASLGLPAVNMTGRFIDRNERNYDLVLRPRDDSYDRVTIHMGETWTIDRLPDDQLAVHDLGTYSLTWRREGDTLVIEREWHLRPARYTPAQYAGLIRWCKANDDAENAKLEFRKL